MSTTTIFLFNDRHGGFGYSQAFRDEFFKRYPDVSPKEFRDLEMSSKVSVRADDRFVSLALELGLQESSGPFCHLDVEEVPTKFLSLVTITEYDGLESYTLNFERLAMNLLHDIMSDENTVVSSALREQYTTYFT
jgi:hypothetical protein